MQIRVGFRLTLQCEAPTPLLLALSPHPDEEHRLAGPYNLRTAPNVPQKSFIDEFGNRRTRLVAPKGAIVCRKNPVIPGERRPARRSRAFEQLACEARRGGARRG